MMCEHCNIELTEITRTVPWLVLPYTDTGQVYPPIAPDPISVYQTYICRECLDTKLTRNGVVL